ncbi:hypothetical protein [Synechocystis salina]|uniref:EF-hand domain-containing protein n=1 Tax=Synechocystis salina LEGE 00031 TaxID=1828736 RepID=A0ABR9VS87_9SYNC|nr:hypothetical protein [Synechocystis salina]MBE9241151.1 hypothetical protein [Synechocystis salina LEGE 00041]MBE9254217.1 hypothetical protein [Synechocystis salina LEGE 00031]
MNKINVNTHWLSSIEKPDSSCYLVHLTDKDSLKKILKSNKKNHGVIISKRGRISFTETPLHGLGFFSRRWPDYKGGQNIRYGLGFTKQSLIKLGVKQAVYLNGAIIKSVKKNLSKVKSLSEEQKKDIATICTLNVNEIELILDELQRISTDNGEIYQKGGFTWEREWILPLDDMGAFEFDYQMIELICCPKEEQTEFWEIIKNVYPIKPDFEQSIPVKLHRRMRFVDIDFLYKKITYNLVNLDDYQINRKRFSHFLTTDSFCLLKGRYGSQQAVEKIRDIIFLADLKQDNFVNESLLRQIIFLSFDKSLSFLKQCIPFFEKDSENYNYIYEFYEFVDSYELLKLIVLDENNLRNNIILSLIALLLVGFDSVDECIHYMIKKDKICSVRFTNNLAILTEDPDWKDMFWKYLYDTEVVIKENLFNYLINVGSIPLLQKSYWANCKAILKALF